MQYCKKCGMEIPEGASFCEKCGNPAGKVPGSRTGKKSVILGISVCGVLLLVAGIFLLVAGVKKDGEKPKQPISTSVAQKTEPGSRDRDTSEEKFWEAYEAYKAHIDKEREEWGDDQIPYDDYHRYALIYLDSDDYPELVDASSLALCGVGVYTYKNGNVVLTTEEMQSGIYYLERKGYLYEAGGDEGNYSAYEKIFIMESTAMRELIHKNYSDENANASGKTIGAEKLAEELGISAEGWISVGGETESKFVKWADTLEEACIIVQRKDRQE